MDEKTIQEKIQNGRNFIRAFNEEYEGYETDQELKKPQPPLVKEPMGTEMVSLPMNFEDLNLENDFLKIIGTRKSHRVYTPEKMNLLQLSFLLWSAQGIREIRGKAYATLRTVPSGGARHPFECYLAVLNMEDLESGLYHYLPMKHALEKLPCDVDLKQFVSDSLCGQSWAAKAGAVFYFSAVFYRAEWRYGIYAHAPMLMDAGHVTENLYLACTAAGLGGCAIAAVDSDVSDQAFRLDEKEEAVFYAMPVGSVSAADEKAEQDFYAFVKEQGL